jgi:hypothetical protein
MTEKYTFENWWDGEITLIYASTLADKGEVIKTADWFEFSDSDIQKIKSKQEVIFKEKVNALLQIQTAEFTRRFSVSEMKKNLLSDEIRQCKEIMFGKIPTDDIVILSHWEIGLEYAYLSDIQRYIKRTIKKGIDEGLGFIHSPNSKYEDNRRPDSRIYARFVWEYYAWIKSFALNQKINFKERSDSKSTKKDVSEQSKLYFQVGLLFANGEMDRLIEKHKENGMPNFSAIARELGNKSFRPYISESFNGHRNSDKNIFANMKRLRWIKTYCDDNGIEVVDSFKNRFKND